LNGSTWPNFLCPNCRAVADLEADVDEPVEFEEADDAADESLLGGNQPSEVNGETTRIGIMEGSSALLSSPMPPDRTSTVRSTETTARTNSSAQVTDMIAAPHIHDDDDVPGFATPEEEDDEEEDDSRETNHTTTASSVAPIPIGVSRSPRSETTTTSSHRERTPSASGTGLATTPSNQAEYALSTNDTQTQDGPMTPRNDHGPFVLDGSGNRATRHVTIGSLDGIAHEPARQDDTDSS
jgi:E3 ubiquitin-protein ligase DMA1/2